MRLDCYHVLSLDDHSELVAAMIILILYYYSQEYKNNISSTTFYAYIDINMYHE